MSYNKRRDENIQRNLQFLEDIGLGSRCNSLPPSRTTEKSKKRSLPGQSEPTRRSMRIATVPPPNYKVTILWSNTFFLFCSLRKKILQYEKTQSQAEPTRHRLTIKTRSHNNGSNCRPQNQSSNQILSYLILPPHEQRTLPLRDFRSTQILAIFIKQFS
jgi:hypothetical protein